MSVYGVNRLTAPIRCWRRWPAPRRPPLDQPRPPALWAARAAIRSAARCAAGRPPRPGSRSSRRCPGTFRRCSAASAPIAPERPTPAPVAGSAGHTARPVAERPAARSRAAGRRGRRSTDDRRSRCTPATAGPVRSRCCARRCSPARGRPDAAAARRAGDVPGHRDVRAAGRGRVRPDRRAAHPATSCGSGWPTGAAPDNPLLGGRGRCSTWRRAGDRRRGARPRRHRPGAAPVRLRRGGLEQLRAWTVAAGAAGGSTPSTAGPYGLGELASGHLARGDGPVALGVAVGRTDLARRPLPLDDVDSTDVDLAGRFAELLDRSGRGAVDACTASRRDRVAGAARAGLCST